jgi:hypothetical protein
MEGLFTTFVSSTFLPGALSAAGQARKAGQFE